MALVEWLLGPLPLRFVRVWNEQGGVLWCWADLEPDRAVLQR
jgi:hypothetical protein